MDLYEYQGKQLFRKFGIPVSDGELVADASDAARATRELGGGPVVVKAQVLTGGRGKAGGVTDPGEQKQLLQIVGALYRCFVETDAMLTEINPLIVTPEGEVKALDSKFTVDENALYRHPDVAAMRDVEAADPLEALAREKGVTYVKLDGDVGILGNGAGLSMSSVDVVAQVGGRPANFCDLGGGGDAQGVVDALEVITRDPQVKSIFFNIFGGITRCDEVARGILEALNRLEVDVPIVVRLDGTNAEEGRRILADAAPPNLHVAPTMLEAAQKAVELAAW